MNFYGLVDSIDIESGIYGRKEGVEIVKKDISVIQKSLGLGSSPTDTLLKDSLNFYRNAAKVAISLPYLVSGIFTFGATLKNSETFKEDKSNTPSIGSNSPIVKLSESSNAEKKETEKNKMVLIPNKGLVGNYNIIGEETLFSLFKTSEQFETIMKSQGNSNLIIFERDNLPSNFKHYGGVRGKFDYGLYCVHPKDKNILIPLVKYNELIKAMILEETLRVFSKLGAKKMLIEDITSVDVSNKLNTPTVKADANVSVRTEKLREKEFGEGVFNPDEAYNDTYFVSDYPNILTVIESRINGNQTLEEFTETININAGLDIDVLGIFKNELNFNYDRKWHFRVEFYDKNKL